MESCGKTPPHASDRPETQAPHHLSAQRRFTSQRRSNEVNYVAPSQAGPAPGLDCPCCGTSPGTPSPRTTRKWSSLHAASNVSQLLRSIKSTRPPVAGPQLTGTNSTEIDKIIRWGSIFMQIRSRPHLQLIMILLLNVPNRNKELVTVGPAIRSAAGGYRFNPYQ